MTRKQWLTIIQKAITDIDGLEREYGMNGLTTTIRLNKDEAVSLFALLQTDIVRCKECKHWQPHSQYGYDYDDDAFHDYCGLLVPDDDYYAVRRDASDFCSYGERRE